MSSVYNNDFGVGPVEFVTFYPGNTNIMLVGSTEGGLFYSSNGGASWVNAGTDVLTISTSGVKGAVFDPSDVNAQSWFLINSALGDLEAAPLGVQPGILRTNDGGATYYNIFDFNNASGNGGLIMNRLLIDPNNSGTLYLATNVGVFKTANANATTPTWTKLSIPNPQTMSTMTEFAGCTCANDPFFAFDVEFLPGSTPGTVNSNELFVSAGFDPGSGSANPGQFWSIMHSNNAGATGSWTELSSLSDINGYNTMSSNGNGFFRNLSALNIEFDPTDNNHAYILARNPLDQGSTIWQFDLTTSSNNQQVIPYVFVRSSNAEGLAVSDGLIAYSNDYTTTLYDMNDGTSLDITDNYSDALNGMHVDHEHEDFKPGNSTELWVSTHGGPYRVNITRGPLSASWVLEVNNLGVAHATGIADSYSEDGFLASGFFHIGDAVTRTPYASSNWDPAFECTQMGDGLHTAISPLDGDYMILATQNGAWQMSDDKGASYINHASIWSDFGSEGVMNKQNKNIVYFAGYSSDPNFPGAYHTISRTMDFGGSMQPITPDLTNLIQNSTGYQIDPAKGYTILEAFTPPSSSNYLYVHILINFQNWAPGPMRERHLIFRTTHADDPIASNILSTWEYCPWANENAWLSGLEFDPYNPNIVYIINSSTNAPNFTNPAGTEMVFKMDYTNPQLVSQNTCSGNCTDLTHNLPNTGVGHLAIALEKGSNGGIYLGTDVGVFYTDNRLISNGTYWQVFGADLPKVRCTGLAINYKENKLRVGLFGRGLWEHSLLCPSTLGLVETGTYSQSDFKEVQNNIVSTANVPSNISMTYRAGDMVDLQTGFKASGTNTFFHAFVHPCDHPGNSFNRYSHGTGNSTKSPVVQNEKISDKRAQVVIQPNPNSGSFLLNIKTNYNTENRVEIFDLMGRMVFSKAHILQQEALKLDVENGTYLIKYYAGIYSESQMIIVNK